MDLWAPKKVHKNLNTIARPVWSPTYLVISLHDLCLPGLQVSLVSRFPWSLNLTWSTVHSQSPICLPGLLCLLCLVLVSLLCLPVHRWSPGLSCTAICMPAWSPIVLHAFLILVLLYTQSPMNWLCSCVHLCLVKSCSQIPTSKNTQQLVLNAIDMP